MSIAKATVPVAARLPPLRRNVVVVALASGWAPVPLLFAAAALLGAGQAIRNPASMLLTRSVVPPEQLWSRSSPRR